MAECVQAIGDRAMVDQNNEEDVQKIIEKKACPTEDGSKITQVIQLIKTLREPVSPSMVITPSEKNMRIIGYISAGFIL
jgi:hypothetical protein